MSTPVDNKYVRAALKRRVVGTIVGFVILLGMIGMVAFHVNGIVKGLTTEYVKTTATVTDEGTERVLEGGRRSKHWVTYRTIDLQFEVDGTTYTDKMRDKTIAVGDDVDVWIAPSGDRYDAFLEKPKPADAWGYIWGGVWLVVALLTLLGIIGSIRRTSGLTKFSIEGRTPALWFTANDIERTGSKRASTLKLTGVSQTHADPRPLKTTLTIAGSAAAPSNYEGQLPVFAIKEGDTSGPMVVYLHDINALVVGDVIPDALAQAEREKEDRNRL